MSVNEHEIQRSLARLDTEDVVDIFATTPERHHRAVGARRPIRRPRRGARPLVLMLVALVAAPLLVWWRAPGLVPEPLLAAVGLGTDTHYSFETRQPGIGKPVGYDPCHAVEVEVNPTGGPSDGVELVRKAMAAVQRATGIRVRYAGRTEDTYRHQPSSGVVVSWSDPTVEHRLAGHVVGFGGSTPTASATGQWVYTRGEVTLDGPAFATMDDGTRLAVVEHEFGHVMGLGHVHDRRQLMYPTQLGQRGYAAGDLRGLAALGRLSCF